MKVVEQRDALLRDVVARLSADHPNLDVPRNLQLAKSLIEADRSPSTDEKAVAMRIEGLVEKFSIVGHAERSRVLKGRYDELSQYLVLPKSRLSSHQHVLFDCLRLIVELANVSVQDPDYAGSQAPLVLVKPMLTWSDIVAEEPLQGEHWDVQSANSQSSDEEEDASDRNESLPAENVREADEPRNDGSLYNSHVTEATEDTALVARFLAGRYFGGNHLQRPTCGAIFSLQDPSSLTPSLVSAAEMKSGLPVDSRFLLEVDVCYEVIAALRGSPARMFVTHGEGLARKITVSTTSPLLLHVSPAAMKSILSDFLLAANVVCTIRGFTNSVLHGARACFGLSVQAFASALARKLENHERKLDKAEVLCRRARKYTMTENEPWIATLVGLRDFLQQDLEELVFMGHILDRTDVAEQAKFAESGQINRLALTTAKMLSELFEAVCESCTAGRDVRTHALMDLFQTAATPYFEGTAAWINSGELHDADEAGNSELFLVRDPQIFCSYPEFWEKAFRFRIDDYEGDPTNCHVLIPSFLEFAKDAILAAGRDAGILRILLEGNSAANHHIPKSSSFPQAKPPDGYSWFDWVARAMVPRSPRFDKRATVRSPASEHPAVFSAHLPLFEYEEQQAAELEEEAATRDTSEDWKKASPPSQREMHDVVRSAIASSVSKSATLLNVLLNDPPWSLNRRLVAISGVCLTSWGGVVDHFADTLVHLFTPPRAPSANSHAVLTVALNSALRVGNAAGCTGAGVEADEGLWRAEFDDSTLESVRKCDADELQVMRMLWGVKLNYCLPHPLPSLIRWRTLDRYYLVARLLLRLRATRKLLGTWAQMRSEQFRRDCRPGKDPAPPALTFAPIRDRTVRQMEMALRFALSRFTASWETFLLRDVCDVEWRRLQATIETARDVMDLRAAFDRFGSALGRKALILPEAAPLLRLLIAVIDLAPELVDAVKRHTRDLAEALESSVILEKAAISRSESALQGRLRGVAEKLERRRRRAVDALTKVGEQAGYAGLEALALSL